MICSFRSCGDILINWLTRHTEANSNITVLPARSVSGGRREIGELSFQVRDWRTDSVQGKEGHGGIVRVKDTGFD